jgi:guanosine-3',5'-bis(diphosphate) 3'-pyrophosphohydrolase
VNPRLEFLGRAIEFALDAHAEQFRKAPEGTMPLPYIVHPLDVMSRLVRAGISDEILLAAAVLHDTIEDCGVSREQLVELFGEEVASVVAEVSDPPGISKRKAKELQVLKAPTMSQRAKFLKLADKTSNVADILVHPPGWKPESILGYTESAFDVVQALDLHGERLHNEVCNRLLNDFFAAMSATRCATTEPR